ncbi:hypothetical protein OUO20_18360 [Arthrobacter sp. FX8]|uniref:hypothetical protein n=1 Tax=Arthrobacter sp. FX8 TaxID=2997335 RepID=UPI00227A6FBE|nr:hypothetical protein [Arthrobacter sp. FX8]WAJ32996.1 hypothetical protein OUO20_18360 [Arthrobacter sp. FX8]
MSEQQQCDPAAGEHHKEVKKHPLSIWTSLVPGDVVAILALEGAECVGTVESKTNDGLIIWIRDALNERKLFHSRECDSVRVIQGTGNTTR